MRRVVDTRRELVGEEPAAGVEELDSEHADVVEGVHERGADRLRLRLRSADGWRPGDAQDPVVVEVLPDGPEPRVAIAAANPDDRKLALEGDELLGDLALLDRAFDVDATLTFAVVAEPPRLDERGKPRLCECPEARGRDAERAEELLLVRRSWPCSSARGPGRAPTRDAASTGTFSNS